MVTWAEAATILFPSPRPLPSRNHAVEKGVNHGWTRIDTDKNGFGRNQLTALITAEAQRRREENAEKENLVIPGS
jgi:hypothetical protein